MRISNMSSLNPKESLAKLTLEALEELLQRQKNILKNEKLLHKLPDKGIQVKERIDKVQKELKLRYDIRDIEGGIGKLSINNHNLEAIRSDKHIEHICSLEKPPEKERYKPFSTLVTRKENIDCKPTRLISLPESLSLQVEQENRYYDSAHSHRRIEGTVIAHDDDGNQEEI